MIDTLLILHSVLITLLSVIVYLLSRSVRKLSDQVAYHREVREKLYQELSDPEKIEADFEKSAHAREMRDAQRSTLPRQDAWPPAKVYRPKMRGAKPGNWRVQRP